MKRNLLAAILCAVAIPASAFASVNSEQVKGKKHAVVAQADQAKSDADKETRAAGATAKKSVKKAKGKAVKATSRTPSAHPSTDMSRPSTK